MNAPVFNNTYMDLPGVFYVNQPAIPVREPALIALNTELANELGLDARWLQGPEGLAMLAGIALPAGAASIAQAYAGQQFGNWVPQLGDGRALLIGEIDSPDGRHFDVQLKGSGPTAFSRNGDGRAALGPVLREYIVSEAMARLGVPTTRALAAVATGQKVQRETALPGGILTRVAASHIRVGTFQYFAARRDTDALQALLSHTIARHYPDADGPMGLLAGVVSRQAELIARWLSLGFIHGVMNTDNMTISGETIDYGPCAFLDEYDPGKVFSSIDRHGRYAYANQPGIAGWNLAQLASSLLPLMGPQEPAIEKATEVVNGFTEAFQSAWLGAFGAKIGLAKPTRHDQVLINDLLKLMAEHGADFTNTFSALREGSAPDWLSGWRIAWQARLAAQSDDPQAIMARANPVVIPRNHLIEKVIEAGYEGDFGPFHEMNAALASPFDQSADNPLYRAPPRSEERVTQTFCGT